MMISGTVKYWPSALFAVAAFALAQPAGAEEVTPTTQVDVQPMAMRARPLNALTSGTILVAGERLSAFWSAGDSLRPMVHARKAGAPWRLIRKPDPTANGRLRADWRLPADLLGTVELRFSEPVMGGPMDSVRVAIAKAAGTEGMGPVLDSALEAAANDFRSESNFIPYRSAQDLAALQARITSADGAAKCLPKAATFRESARNDSRAFNGGMPILVSRVRYHYRDPLTSALVPGEFRAAGFPESALASQRVLLMLDDAYYLSNVADPVVRVEVRIGQDSLIVRRNAQREYVFTADGMQTVFLRAFTANGDSWEQATVVDVPPIGEAPAVGAADGKAIGAERSEGPVSSEATLGGDLAAGKPDSKTGSAPARN